MGIMDFLTGKDINRKYDRMIGTLDEIKNIYDSEYKSAARLAVALHDKHYPEITGWRVGGDILTVIDQIDNMTSGMVRNPDHE